MSKAQLTAHVAVLLGLLAIQALVPGFSDQIETTPRSRRQVVLVLNGVAALTVIYALFVVFSMAKEMS